MKYPGGNTSTLFCEQVGTVTSLFEQWNDCERTVVLYALLKRVPFANLKFLQLSIEYNLAQNYNSQTKLHVLENNSNNAVFLTKLINTYKSFKSTDAQLMKKESAIIYETDNVAATTATTTALNTNTNGSQHFNEHFGKYDKKEDILNDILIYLPLLKPGNDDAKAVFLSLIPCAVDDSVRQIVPIELVQQILSYLLIHPAISNEDRRSLSQWLRHLEDHISLSYVVQNKAPNYFLIPSETSSPSSSLSTTWLAVAPPISQQKLIHDNKSWDMKSIQVTQEFCDEIQLKDFQKTIGKKVDFNKTAVSSSNSSGSQTKSTALLYDNGNDDHHVSFSKNGTEILEYDGDEYDNKSNTQIAYDPITATATMQDFLTVPNFNESNALKTRRSNSLTTTTTVSQQVISSSSENLASILQKPRSFSLSMESPRSSLTSSGSETRLDDYKPNYMKFASCYAGMGNIGQWLKSLRLHKYIWLFSNMTYEQMLEINEAYLESVGVTKGARNKLVLCIQKLKERVMILNQMRKDLSKGIGSMSAMIDELLIMVLTPMKPVDPHIKDDVAGMIMQVLDMITKTLLSRQGTQNEEELISSFGVVLERAFHSEGFSASSDNIQLKEHKFKLSKLKLQFTPKTHYVKANGSGNGLNKARWNSNSGPKQHKTSGPTGHEKTQRKNSNFSMNNNHPAHLLQEYHEKCQALKMKCSSASFYLNNTTATTATTQTINNYNKSSSYPNFTSSSASSMTIAAAVAAAAAAAATTTATTTENKSVKARQHHSPGIGDGGSGGGSSDGNGIIGNSGNNYHRHSLNNISLAPSPVISTPVVCSVSAVAVVSTNSPHIITSNCGSGGGGGVGGVNSNQQQQQQHTILVNNRLNNKENRTCNNKEAIIEPPTSANCNNINNNNNNNNIKISSCNSSSSSSSSSNSKSQKSSIIDINSRLEFLCLQMTEQAIN